MRRMLWHDTRVEGESPKLASNTHHSNEDSDIDGSINWVASYAKSQGGLSELIIICHGAYVSANAVRGVTDASAPIPGFGLVLCKQKLHLGNINKVQVWKPWIQRVTIYACGAARTEPGNEGTWGDGMRLMGEFAIYSGAYVIAPRDPQTYSYSTGWFSSAIDFGQWEGPVYAFDPRSGKGKPYSPGQMR